MPLAVRKTVRLIATRDRLACAHSTLRTACASSISGPRSWAAFGGYMEHATTYSIRRSGSRPCRCRPDTLEGRGASAWSSTRGPVSVGSELTACRCDRRTAHSLPLKTALIAAPLLLVATQAADWKSSAKMCCSQAKLSLATRRSDWTLRASPIGDIQLFDHSLHRAAADGRQASPHRTNADAFTPASGLVTGVLNAIWAQQGSETASMAGSQARPYRRRR